MSNTHLLDQIIITLQQQILEGRDDDIESIISGVIHAAEIRDPASIGHAQRVASYTTLLANALGLPTSEEELYHKAAQMHDIGKINIKGSILRKPGPLTTEEYEDVKTHAIVGETLCKIMDPLSLVSSIVRHHHEHYSGQGYPDGLIGENIPLGSRIIALSDTFDTMTTNRTFRSGMPFERAITLLQANATQQWDPALLGHFINAIRSRYGSRPFHTSDPLFMQVLENLPIAVMVLNTAGQPIIQNKLAHKISKYFYDRTYDFMEKIAEYQMREIPDGPILASEDTPIGKALQGLTTYNHMIYFDHPVSSAHIAHLISAAPLYHSDGSIQGAIIIFTELLNAIS